MKVVPLSVYERSTTAVVVGRPPADHGAERQGGVRTAVPDQRLLP